jgi:hypothetical protein
VTNKVLRDGNDSSKAEVKLDIPCKFCKLLEATVVNRAVVSQHCAVLCLAYPTTSPVLTTTSAC